MKKPLLTVVTVTKNCVTTIERTLRSVHAVKSSDLEYIIIDGVSSDGTLSVIAKYRDIVDILVSEPDTGLYNAMNKGAARATGRYTLFIHGDDEIVAEGLLDAMKHLARATAEVVCCNSLVLSDDGRRATLMPQPLRLLFYNSIPHPSTFVASTVLKEFPFREDLKIAADYDFFLRLLVGRKKFITLDVASAIHRRGGISADSDLSHREVERVKRERLGKAYNVITAVHWIYRSQKKLFEVITRNHKTHGTKRP